MQQIPQNMEYRLRFAYCAAVRKGRGAAVRLIFAIILGVGTVKLRPLWLAALLVFLANFLMSGVTGRHAVHAQGLVPWRHGVMQPNGDAGWRWMTAEGGFAARQGLGLRMVPFDNETHMFKAL